MGKKKKKTKGHQGGTSNDAGEEFGDDVEFEEGSDAWLAQQRKLFEQFQKEKEQSHIGSAGSSTDGVLLHSNTEKVGTSNAVIEQQRRLLEQASTGSVFRSSASGSDTMEPATSVAGDSVATGGEVFVVRRVSFLGRQVPTLLQNRNGPCSLLAVANALLLRGTMRLSDKEDFLTSTDLVTRLGHLCETLNARAIHEDPNARKSIQDLVQRLPRLLDGLDVNCRFSGCLDFEYTADMALFDYFDLKIFHVWVEPTIFEVAASWNDLSECLAVCSEIRADLEYQKRRPTPAECEKLAQAVWLEEWLEETRSQATPLGFQYLMDAVKENEVCVLFRNNHFTTVFKPSIKSLGSLLTDISFEGTTSIVWESIAQDSSSGVFLDEHFLPSSSKAPLAKAGVELKLTPAQHDLLRVVEEMGFSRVQAEAGLVAVAWHSAEEAVEVLLEANGDVTVLAAKGSVSSVQTGQHVCPTCGKEFKSLHGKLNHRAAKQH